MPLIYAQSSIDIDSIPEEIKNDLIEQAQENISLISVDDLENGGEDVSIDDEFSNDFIKSEKFGFDFIRTIPRSITSTSDLPVPNDYIISLGDTIKIILTGGKKDIVTLKVGLDGNIFFPELGTLSIFGESLSDAKEKIESLVKLSYVNTEVSISLVELSAKKINIIGAVNNPGTYIVNPFTTVTSGLAYSGGFSDYASVRDIKIIRKGKVLTFDLYDFLIFGKRNNDINIEQGDTILVQSTNNFIEINGAVNRPLIYEFKENESINDLLEFAMGLKNNSNKNKLAIVYYDDVLNSTGVKEFKLSENKSLSDFKNPLSFEIFPIELDPKLNVKVEGPIQNQGFFDLPKTKNLKDLLDNLNFTSTTYEYLGLVQNKNSSKLFSIKDKNTHNVPLEENSEILFFTKEEALGNKFDETKLNDVSIKLIDDYALKVLTNDTEIYFPFYGEIFASEVIDYLGIDKNGIYESQTTYVSPLDDTVLVGNSADLKFKAKIGNKLVLRDFRDQTVSVGIFGEVVLPGSYTLKKGTTLQGLYDLVEGLTDSADSKSIIFTRESIKEKQKEAYDKNKLLLQESITQLKKEDELDSTLMLILSENISDDSLGRISGNLLINSEISSSFLLEEGDYIFIPKQQNTISVFGEVLNPSSFIYQKGMSLRDVINKAGGYNQKALKRGVYVIRSNGTIEVSKGLFAKNIKIMPGDSIIVPTDFNAGNDFISSLAPITAVLSNIAFSAAAIDNLRQ